MVVSLGESSRNRLEASFFGAGTGLTSSGVIPFGASEGEFNGALGSVVAFGVRIDEPPSMMDSEACPSRITLLSADGTPLMY